MFLTRFLLLFFLLTFGLHFLTPKLKYGRPANTLPGFYDRFQQPKNTKLQGYMIIHPEDIGRYINQIRTSPSIIAQIIQQRINKKQFKNKTEWEQALKYVLLLEKIYPCNFSVVLERAAVDHAQDLVSKSYLTHVGSNGSSIYNRIERYTDWNNGTVSQIVLNLPMIANNNHPLEILLKIIVNEGMPSKAYRNALFNPQYRYYGVSVRMQGNKAVAVLLLSTNQFKLDYPDQPALQKKYNNKGGKSNSNLFGKPIQIAKSAIVASQKNIVTITITSLGEIKGNFRPPRIMKKIFQDGTSIEQKI